MDMNKMFSLTGKTALVTGAAYGIGFAIAEALAGAGQGLPLTAEGRSIWKKPLRHTGKKELTRKGISVM